MVDAPADPAAAAVVRKRLLLGGLAVVATAAFAKVPTDALRFSRPAKPLFMYVTPIVAARPVLARAAEAASEARWSELATLHAALEAAPLSLPENLRAVAAHQDTAAVRERASALARDAVEYVAQIDYDAYFESVGGVGLRGGAREKQFADFSAAAARAAVASIDQLLALVPADAVEAAAARAGAGAV